MRLRSCFLLALSFAWIHSASAEILYSVTDLGTLPGYSAPVAVGINNLGDVAGTAFSGDNAHPFLYSNGQWTDLGTLGGERTFASGLNDNGQVVGYSVPSSGNSHAFLYKDGQMIDLGLSGGATGINNAGQIVGPFGVYNNGEITPVTPLRSPGTYPVSTYATAISNRGEVTGYTDFFTGSLFEAFLYSNGQIIDVAPSGRRESRGLGLNDAGQVVGAFGDIGDSQWAFLYSNGQAKDLGSLPGYIYSEAIAINNPGQPGEVGQVVGWVAPYAIERDHHAFLYTDGQMKDLNDLIDPALEITLTEARGVNDRGQIVAGGTVAGRYGVFLLTPVPEPSTLALFAGAFSGLWLWSRHRR